MIFLRTNNDNAIINRLNYHFEDLFLTTQQPLIYGTSRTMFDTAPINFVLFRMILRHMINFWKST